MFNFWPFNVRRKRFVSVDKPVFVDRIDRMKARPATFPASEVVEPVVESRANILDEFPLRKRGDYPSNFFPSHQSW